MGLFKKGVMDMNRIKIKFNFNVWSTVSFFIVFIIILPNFEIILKLITPANENWKHITQFMLKIYILDSIKLVIAVVFFSGIIGFISAYIVTFYDFPLRKFFKWVLALAMAIPPYIGAYTYSALLSYTGFIQTFLRNNAGIKVNQKFFNIMNVCYKIKMQQVAT